MCASRCGRMEWKEAQPWEGGAWSGQAATGQKRREEPGPSD